VPGPERWIDLCDPDEATLAAAIPVQVHSTAMDRLPAPARHYDEPRPRLEAHGNYVFGVLVLPTIDENAEVTVHEVDGDVTLFPRDIELPRPSSARRTAICSRGASSS
jgi:hypothetical protein